MFDIDQLNPLFLEIKMKAGLWSGDAAPSYYYDPVNFTKLEITPAKQEKSDVLSNMLDSIGETLDTQYTVTEGATLSAELNTFNEELGALLLGADVDATTQAAAALVDQPVLTALGRWAPLAHKRLDSDGFSLKDAGDALVDGAKYELDARLGLIKPLHADAVGAMSASYTVQATHGRAFNAGKSKVFYLQLIGTAKDKKSGQYGDLTIHKVAVIADQSLDFAAGKHLQGVLNGVLIRPAGAPSPYRFEPWEAAA
jgi:hypothetical protein